MSIYTQDHALPSSPLNHVLSFKAPRCAHDVTRSNVMRTEKLDAASLFIFFFSVNFLSLFFLLHNICLCPLLRANTCVCWRGKRTGEGERVSF